MSDGLAKPLTLTVKSLKRKLLGKKTRALVPNCTGGISSWRDRFKGNGDLSVHLALQTCNLRRVNFGVRRYVLAWGKKSGSWLLGHNIFRRQLSAVMEDTRKIQSSPPVTRTILRSQSGDLKHLLHLIHTRFGQLINGQHRHLIIITYIHLSKEKLYRSQNEKTYKKSHLAK